MPLTKDQIANILAKNYNKDFVQRILNPQLFPVIKNKDGTVSTHKMAWSEAGGKYYVYPTIQRINDQLIELKDDEAFNSALKNEDFIVFDDKKEAADFSKNYKIFWK